jgi:hypothetical protein
MTPVGRRPIVVGRRPGGEACGSLNVTARLNETLRRLAPR